MTRPPTTNPSPTPTLSAQQRRVIATPTVTHVGFDAKNRPVVEQPHTWGPGIPSRWALKRDGDPVDIVEPVTDIGGDPCRNCGGPLGEDNVDDVCGPCAADAGNEDRGYAHVCGDPAESDGCQVADDLDAAGDLGGHLVDVGEVEPYCPAHDGTMAVAGVNRLGGVVPSVRYHLECGHTVMSSGDTDPWMVVGTHDLTGPPPIDGPIPPVDFDPDPCEVDPDHGPAAEGALVCGPCLDADECGHGLCSRIENGFVCQTCGERFIWDDPGYAARVRAMTVVNAEHGRELPPVDDFPLPCDVENCDRCAEAALWRFIDTAAERLRDDDDHDTAAELQRRARVVRGNLHQSRRQP